MYIPTIQELKDALREGIISRHPKIRNFSSGSMLDIMNEIVAVQAYLLYCRVDESTKSISILTATGDDLDALVIDRLPFGRQEGTQSTGYLTFKSNTLTTAAVPIPLGSKALAIGSDGTRLYFETTAYGEIPISDYSIVIAAHSVEPGTENNISSYAVTQLAYSIEGVDQVENAAAFTGGTDEETDNELRNRYYYAVLVTGTATQNIIEEHLTDLEDVSESHIYPRSYGDIEVIVDYDEGIGSDSTEINDVLEENIAAGIISRGILGATVINGVVSNNLAESSGGRIWVRATSNVLAGESFSITYYDILSRIRTATVVIPEGTVRGDTVQATLEDSDDRVEYINEVIYSSIYSYDILIGMGIYPYLYVLPRTVLVDSNITIHPTSTAPATLDDDIEASITDFLNAFQIGEDLEWSDLFLNIYVDYATSAMFTGIDNISICSITGNSTTITTPGSLINIAEDQRIRAGSITVTLV